MLNDWKNGTAAPAWAADADDATCHSCHTTLYTDKKVGASHPSGQGELPELPRRRPRAAGNGRRGERG